MKPKRGRLTVFFGPMFSGKTAELAEIAHRLSKIAGRIVSVFMPSRDTRRATDAIVSLGGARASAIQVEDPFEILEWARKEGAEEVLIDEVHLFQQRTVQDKIEDWSIVFVVKELLRQGINVYVAGVNTDFTGHPFSPTVDLMGLASEGGLRRTSAICTYENCGDRADWSLRLIDGRPVGPGAPLIVVAGAADAGEQGKGKETYQARCGNHHPFL